jgi:hypothetical protein
MPEGTLRRAVLALGAGVLLLCALHRLVVQEPVRRPASAELPPAGAAARAPAVLASLRGPGARLVYLAPNPAALPAGAAPAVAVHGDGELQLLRPPPRPAPAPPRSWPGAGVVLPGGDLAALTAVQRGALLDVLGAMSGGRCLGADQLVPRGVAAPPAVREALLRWLR